MVKFYHFLLHIFCTSAVCGKHIQDCHVLLINLLFFFFFIIQYPSLSLTLFELESTLSSLAILAFIIKLLKTFPLHIFMITSDSVIIFASIIKFRKLKRKRKVNFIQSYFCLLSSSFLPDIPRFIHLLFSLYLENFTSIWAMSTALLVH